MRPTLQSLHHVTATVRDAQEDLDFYTNLLGLRLVKKTVNFDNTGVYHLYYGDAHGRPGTIMTTFPYAGKGVPIGTKGAGQVTTTSFSVPAGSLDFWRARLARHGVEVRDAGRRFGREVLTFDDPSGLVLDLVEDDDDRAPWTTGEIDAAHALRGVHSVTLTIRDPEPTSRLLQDVLGLALLENGDGEAERRLRFGIGAAGPGRVLDVLHAPDADRAVNGIGTVHHVALAVGTEAEQREIQEKLRELGFSVTDVRDRQYFRSIYFREPGGVLLEIATAGPGFLVDEDEEALGRGLKLPPWEESNRGEIEAGLPPLRL